MTPMWRKTLMFMVLLFQSRTFGRFDKQKDTTFISLPRKSRGETLPSIRRGLHSKGSKGMVKRMSMKNKKGKSKKTISVSTLLPTSTKLPAPSVVPTPSTSTSSVPVSKPSFSTSLPTALLFQTFTPTVGASVAPTYIITTGIPSKMSKSSILPTSTAKLPTQNPSGSQPTLQTVAPVKPSSPVAPPNQSPFTPAPPTPAPPTPTQTPPTQTPPTPTPPTPTQTPPTPIQTIPTQRPQSVPPSPSQVPGPQIVDLSPFALNYTLSRPRIPFRTEYVELANFTGVYLENFFRAFYRNATGIQLSAVVVIYKSASIFFGSPIQVEFEAIATFSSKTTPVPTMAQLDSLLTTAFTGNRANGYVNFIQHQLPNSNTFATTENVTLVPTTKKSVRPKMSEKTSVGGSGKSTTGGSALALVAISIGAVAAAAFVASMAVMYRRHRKFDPTTQIDKRPPSYLSVTGGRSDNSTLADSSSLEDQRRYPGVQDNSDEQSVDSSNWNKFVHQPEKQIKKSPRQIMSEMDLLSAMGEGAERS